MSPRKKKQRNCICPLREKLGLVFKPAGTPLKEMEVIVLDHDELEALFLCDKQGLNQEAAGELMGVSRERSSACWPRGGKRSSKPLWSRKPWPWPEM